tara:strand:- start:671 stop:934 length:264 start_codon:yes stop_codon:yes gene_type:complete
VPDANTVWKYEELLVQKNLTDELFYQLLSQMETQGYQPQSRQIVDTIVIEASIRKTEEQQQRQPAVMWPGPRKMPLRMRMMGISSKS